MRIISTGLFPGIPTFSFDQDVLVVVCVLDLHARPSLGALLFSFLQCL